MQSEKGLNFEDRRFTDRKIFFRMNTWYLKILLGRCAVYHILIWGGIVKPLQTKVRFNY